MSWLLTWPRHQQPWYWLTLYRTQTWPSQSLLVTMAKTVSAYNFHYVYSSFEFSERGLRGWVLTAIVWSPSIWSIVMARRVIPGWNQIEQNICYFMAIWKQAMLGYGVYAIYVSPMMELTEFYILIIYTGRFLMTSMLSLGALSLTKVHRDWGTSKRYIPNFCVAII